MDNVVTGMTFDPGAEEKNVKEEGRELVVGKIDFALAEQELNLW